MLSEPSGALFFLERKLLENSARGGHAVIVIDESHTINDPEVIQLFKSILGIEYEGKPCVSFLFLGEPSLLLGFERFPSLNSRIDIHCNLRAMNEEETAAYISHRLHLAGSTKEIFVPESVSKIHELSGGIPRAINRLCDLALLIGLAEELPVIGEEVISELNNELIAV